MRFRQWCFVVTLVLIAASFATSQAAAQGNSDCSGANAFYDDGSRDGTLFFGGGRAGDPNYMYAVKFELSDFGFAAGGTEITGFCASNQNAYPGGPWPNEVFIYPDAGGLPDESTVLGQGTVYTGDGETGQWYEVTLSSPVTLDGDFWLVMRGDAQWVGEDFNMDADGTSPTGNSYLSETGVASLSQSLESNYMLRAKLRSEGGGFGDGPYNYHVAAIVHSSGVGGAFFETNLGVLNLSESTADVVLTYFWRNGPTTVSKSLAKVAVAGDRLEVWDDVVLTLFGLGQNTSGSLLVNSTTPLLVTTRTFTTDSTGTFGSFMPGVELGDGVADGETGLLSQLIGNNEFRTNIGVVNLTASSCQARVQLKSPAGADIGSVQTLNLDAYSFKQINDVFAAAGAGSRDNAYATVEAVTSGCRVWAYASVIDGTNASPGTNDPTLIPMTVVD
jgi:hypothetical protein